MKRLTLLELEKEDSLRLSFEGAFDGQIELEREFEPFLQALESHAGDWMPDLIEGKRRRRYSRPTFWKSEKEARTEYGSILGFYRMASPAVALTLDIGAAQGPSSFSVGLNIQPLSFFAEAKRCHDFIELVRAWAARYVIPHASAHSMADGEWDDSPSFGREQEIWRRDGFDKVYTVSWLNVFGPELVRTVGRERMLSTPAHRVEELPNGSILLVTWPTAADFASPEARLAQARALVHLRPELDLPTLLRSLHERSAALAPVEPRFHPDLAPLLSRTLERSSLGQRQRRIAQLNAWQPPTPDEWVPASEALPADTQEAERLLSRYERYAEGLVAMLHTLVPSVFDATPESLTDLDHYFWLEDFPNTRPRQVVEQEVVLLVGAYLGECLVRHLGGQWIPRAAVGEAQVRVGERAWWPMVRARRYLRSRESLLDFSLTQFFREAERHRGPSSGSP